jgi:hypothetical protein
MAFGPFVTPLLSCFTPLWKGNKAKGNANLTQTFFNKRMGKPIGGIIFNSPSFNNKFELNASSPI